MEPLLSVEPRAVKVMCEAATMFLLRMHQDLDYLRCVRTRKAQDKRLDNLAMVMKWWLIRERGVSLSLALPLAHAYRQALVFRLACPTNRRIVRDHDSSERVAP